MQTIDGNPIDESHKKIKSAKLFASFSPKNGEVEKWNIAKIIYPGGLLVDGLELIFPLVGLDQHMLDDQTVNSVAEDSITDFLDSRSKIVAKRVESLTGCVVSFALPINYMASETTLDDEFEEEQ